MEQETDTAVVDKPDTEEQLISTAQSAVSQCNWVVGECASQWTQRYAKGRTDTDFGVLVGLSGDQVFQRRRVWETFGLVHDKFPALKWSHYYVSLNWDNAQDCLEWASENETTVAEMKAWRRALLGEDLTKPSDSLLDDWGNIPVLNVDPTQLTEVRMPSESVPFDVNGEPGTSSDPVQRDGVDVMTAAARDTGGYAPFRSDAGTTPPNSESGGDPMDKPRLAADKLLKKMTRTLERISAELSTQRVAELRELPEKERIRFVSAVSDLSNRVSEASL